MYLAIGLLAALIIASIFISLKRSAKSRQHSNRRNRRAPHFTPVPHEPEINADDVLGLSEHPQSNAKPRNDIDPQYICVNLMATSGEFGGYELLQALLANGMRFGKQHIFHRYRDQLSTSPIVFSLASVAKPGTFDLQKMGNFSTPGLTLFVVLTETPDPLKSFDDMLETAYQLADDLNAMLLDDKRAPLTRETISKWRKQVKHFIENQKVGDLFEVN